MLNQDIASTKPVLPSRGFVLPLPMTLAVSTQWHNIPEKSDWLVEQGFSLEYTPDAGNLNRTAGQLAGYIAAGARIRHHGYFPGYEIGDSRSDRAEEAMQLHFQALDAIRGVGEQHITVHVGLVADIELNPAHVVRNLRRLVDYGRHHGITVSLENLRFGPTSNPETVLEWTQKTGAKITLDIGHAVSCSRVVHNEMNVPRIIDLFSHDLVEVHFYESETDRHHAPQDMRILGPIVDRLLSTECTWWTIELDAHEEILRTRNLLSGYLESPTHQRLSFFAGDDCQGARRKIDPVCVQGSQI
jgi:sugar phosphate isomerase/epimerase